MAGAVLDAWTRIGATVIPVGSGNTERLVKAFQLLGAEALGCTPSYALYLADWCRERDIDPRSLGIRHIAVAGEPGGGEAVTRRAIEEAFGATVREAMGIADVSPSLWGECEEQAGMHFCGRDFVHAELIDPAGDAPVPWEDGAEGELVYTSLRREAMPVVRFRSRDRVVVTARPCSCGRTSVRVRCIGRTDDLLIVRGTNLFPSAVREVVGEFRPRVGGMIQIRPAHTGVRQDVAPRVLVELGEGERAGEELSARDPAGDPRQARRQHRGRARPLRDAAPQRVQEPPRRLLGVGYSTVLMRRSSSRAGPQAATARSSWSAVRRCASTESSASLR